MSEKEISGSVPVAGASPGMGEAATGAGAGAARLAVCVVTFCPAPDAKDLSLEAGVAL